MKSTNMLIAGLAIPLFFIPQLLFSQGSDLKYPKPEYTDEIYQYNAESNSLEGLEIVKANTMAKGGYGVGNVSLRFGGATSNVTCIPSQQFIIKLSETDKRPEYLIGLYKLEVQTHPTKAHKNYRYFKIARQGVYQSSSNVEEGKVPVIITKIDENGTMLVKPSQPLPSGEYVFSIETKNSAQGYGAAFKVR